MYAGRVLYQRKTTLTILLILVLSYQVDSDNVTVEPNDERVRQATRTNGSSASQQTELIEYYDVDDAATATDTIYPNPDELLLRSNRHDYDYAGEWGEQNKRATAKFSQLKEIDSGITEPDVADALVHHNGEFRGKSIDFDGSPDTANDDLADHNVIDNFMYIYYGSNMTLRKNLGGSIIIVGTVLALAAQILTTVFTMLRNRQIRRTNTMSTISLNLLMTLCASNLVFIVGVQTSRNAFKCETVAVLLHYFHLSTATWGLCHALGIYNFVMHGAVPVMKYNNLMAYCGSAVYVLFSFAMSSNSYEVHDYCWMSVQRGMIINFMIPTSMLIIATTILGTLSLRAVTAQQRQVIVESIENILDKCHHIDATVNCNWNGDYVPAIKCCDELQKRSDEMQKNYENSLKSMDFYDSKFDLGALSIAELSLQSTNDVQDYGEYKRAIKFSLFFQPAFCVCWFFGVVALENRHSCIMPVIFVVCYNILNWYILCRFPHISPLVMGPQQTNAENNLDNSRKSDQFTSTMSVNEQENQTPSCTDTIPLLCSVTASANVANSGAPTMVNAIETTVHNGSTIVALHSSEVSLSRSLSMEDILYKTSMAQWDTGTDYSNADCISTISN